MVEASLRTLLSAVIMSLLLFLPAGTLAWPQAWAFLLLFNFGSVAIGLWLTKTDPDLLEERSKSPFASGQGSGDRRIMAAIVAFFAVWFVAMALDARRFGWSHAPLWVEILGATLIVAAFIGWIGVLRTNRFASTTIRVQAERGQSVISTGPYAWVRHPMYTCVLIMIAGTPMLLGSLWGLLGILVAAPLIGARALREETMLTEGLPGYRDYAERVRFRFVPGVW